MPSPRQPVPDDLHQQNSYLRAENNALLQKIRELEARVGSDSGEWFRQIFDATPDGIVLIRLRDEVIVHANQRFCDVSGYSAEQLIGNTDRDLKMWVNDDQRREGYSQLGARRRLSNLEARLRCANGRELDALISVRIIQALDGEPLAVVDVRDVSAYKRALRELIESENRFAQAFNDIPVPALIVCQDDQNVLYANPEFGRFAQLEEATFIGRPIVDLLEQLGPAPFADFARTMHQRCEPRRVLFTRSGNKQVPALVSSSFSTFNQRPCAIILLQDQTSVENSTSWMGQALDANPDAAIIIRLQERRVLLVNQAFCTMAQVTREQIEGTNAAFINLWRHWTDLSQLFDAPRNQVIALDAVLSRSDGNAFDASLSAVVVGDPPNHLLIINLRDVTQSRASERRLRSSQARFEKLFFSAPIAIAIYRVSDEVLVDVNPAYARLFGVSVQSVRGQYANQRKNWLDQNAFDEFSKQLIAELEVRNYEATLIGGSGPFSASLSARVLRIDDQAHVLFYIVDMQEIRRMQEQLRHGQKMEAIGHLAGGVAHDFNNLLNGIQGFTELMLTADETSEGQRKHLHKILSAVHRAGELTKQLLIFARRDAPEIKPVDLHDIINNAHSILEHSIDRRVQIVRVLAAEHPLVLGDESHIENALLNLCINARDAMPNGGHITISTALVNVNAEWCKQQEIAATNRPMLRVSVADTGTGIEDNVLERIFEPFFTTKGVGAGTGLGLPAVWGMVRAHGGGLDVETKVGSGTTFHLYLPTTDERRQVRRNLDGNQLTLGTGRILVADDEPMLRELFSTMLASLGYEVLLAPDGAEALQIYRAKRHELDLVVLDMTMPRMNGRETIEAIKQIDANARVLLTSGYVQSEELNYALAAGAIGVLHKPFNLAHLSRRVADALQKRRPIPN